MADSSLAIQGDESSISKSVLIWNILSVLILGGMIFFSLNPTYFIKHIISRVPYSDPAMHIFSFGILMFCYCQAWKQNKIRMILAVCLLLFGLGLEILQVTLWGGAFEIEDSFANILGVGLGYLMSRVWNCYRLHSTF